MNKGQYKYKKKMRTLKKYNRGNRTIQSKKYRNKYPNKIKAYNALYRAMQKGTIVKPSKCELCNNTKWIMGHHEDYNKSLDIKWVCWKCHNKITKKIGGD